MAEGGAGGTGSSGMGGTPWGWIAAILGKMRGKIKSPQATSLSKSVTVMQKEKRQGLLGKIINIAGAADQYGKMSKGAKTPKATKGVQSQDFWSA